MRVSKPARVQEYCEEYREAIGWLKGWLRIVQSTQWETFTQLRLSFPQADPVKVKSGRPVVVFNALWNRYRLICAVHFNTRRVYVLKFMTHAEYDRDTWKTLL